MLSDYLPDSIFKRMFSKDIIICYVIRNSKFSTVKKQILLPRAIKHACAFELGLKKRLRGDIKSDVRVRVQMFNISIISDSSSKTKAILLNSIFITLNIRNRKPKVPEFRMASSTSFSTIFYYVV